MLSEEQLKEIIEEAWSNGTYFESSFMQGHEAPEFNKETTIKELLAKAYPPNIPN